MHEVQGYRESAATVGLSAVLADLPLAAVRAAKSVGANALLTVARMTEAGIFALRAGGAPLGALVEAVQHEQVLEDGPVEVAHRVLVLLALRHHLHRFAVI